MTRLLLLATGGTIAGRGADGASLNTYTAGVLAGDELLDAVPSLQDLAEIRVEQVANVDSADLLFSTGACWCGASVWRSQAILPWPEW